MFRTFPAILVPIVLSSAAAAQVFTTSGGARPADASPAGPHAAAAVCQANDNETILTPHGIACSDDNGITTSETGHARLYEISGDTLISGVTYGVETCRDNTGQGRPCELSLIAWDAPNFPSMEGATELGTVIDPIPDGTAGQVRTINFDAPVEVAGGTNLVVELFHEDWTAQWAFFPGSNNAGQSAPTYIRSIDCDTPDWVDLATIPDGGGGFFDDVFNIICYETPGGESCGNKATLKPACKKGGAKVKAVLKKADPRADVTFRIDGGMDQQVQTNGKGKAKVTWNGLDRGGHEVTVCDLQEGC